MSKIMEPKVNDALILAKALECLANALRSHSENRAVNAGWKTFEKFYSESAKWNHTAIPSGLPVRLGLRHIENPSSNVYVFTFKIGKLGAPESSFDGEQGNLVNWGEFTVVGVPY